MSLFTKLTMRNSTFILYFCHSLCWVRFYYAVSTPKTPKTVNYIGYHFRFPN